MTTVETDVPDVVLITSVVFASLSLLGATYIFISFILHKRLRSFSFRMILWMCIFDFILGCATICGPLGTIEEEAGIKNENGEDIINPKLNIGNEYESSLPLICKLQAASIQFSIIGSLLWTLCFAIHLYRISSPYVNPSRTHSYCSLFIYLFISIPIPMFLTYYIFAQNIVGISSDFWCWINDEYLDQWASKMLYIMVGILVIILFILYFVMKVHLKKFIEKSNNNNNDLVLNRSRLSFVRTISGGLSSYLFAPFISFIPAHFNIICTMLGLEWNQHVLSWYILSGILLGVLHIGIYICGINIVRYSWITCCNKKKKMMHQRDINKRNSRKEFINRSLQQSNKHYMELV